MKLPNVSLEAFTLIYAVVGNVMNVMVAGLLGL